MKKKYLHFKRDKTPSAHGAISDRAAYIALMKKRRAALLAQKAKEQSTLSPNVLTQARKLSWTQYLRLSIRFARLSYKAFVRKHRLLSRCIALLLALLIVLGIYADVHKSKPPVNNIAIPPRYAALIGDAVPQYSERVKIAKDGGFTYNEEYSPAAEKAGDSSVPKIKGTFGSAKTGAVTIQDPVNEVGLTFTPKFGVLEPQQDKNRIVYRAPSKNARIIYSLKGSGVKEDIVLDSYKKDVMTFVYELGLPEGTEARLEKNGSLGVYGVNAVLLGNVTTGTEQDAELLKKARENAPKNTLLFTVPAPVVLEGVKKISASAKAWFTLEGNVLTVHANGLKKANYPLSIDPSIYVETARKLMRGNNETNIDFDVDNELIQKSQTTGARIDSWSSTTNLSSAVYGQGTAVAGGFIYSAGGIGSGAPSSTPYSSAGSSNYVVPAGVNYITVKVWGAGGSGGNGSGGTGTGGAGGGGGYAKAVIAVTPGETLTIDVGSAGVDRGTSSSAGGNGGGYSAVLRSGTFLVQAGGGGGGGGSRGSNSGDGGNGGAGGGATAANGVTGEGTSAGGGGFGGSTTLTGTPSDGGAAGGSGTGGASGVANGGGNGAGSDAATCNDAMEAADTGGNGGTGAGGAGGNDTTSCANGGGGGGGRFGGGGGGSNAANNNRGGGGGGGGSSYINPTGLVAGTDVQTTGSGATPGNSGDSDRGTAGDGGAGGTTTSGGVAGVDGKIVLSYTTTGSISNKLYWAQFNSTTNAIESPNPGAGVCTGWCNDAAYDLPVALTGLSLVAYNGFLYAIGGQTSAGTPQTTVYIAKLGANGEPQLWHPTGGTPAYWYSDTALTNARSQFAAVAYNNRLYLFGGLTTSTTVLSTNTVQFADIRPNGTLTAFTATGMQALTTARYGVTAHIYNGVAYVLGGNATFSGSPVTTVEYARLNATSGTMSAWQTTSSIATSGRLTLGGSFSTVFGGYLYVNGGCSAVNASGYCTTIASGVQLASINADGSLGPFNTILGLANDRFAHTMIAWQGGLYRLGGCREQDLGAGGCSNTVLDVDYGVINPDGEASTVATSTDNTQSPCNLANPYNCNLPSSIGNMLNATAIVNGYLYIMGGCTNNACTSFSSGVTYQSIGSDGSLQRPSSCGGSYTDSYCVSYQSLPTALGASGVTVFNNRIYIVGGFPTIDNIYYVSVNPDGSLGAWQNNNTNTGTTTLADQVSYTYAYARANPASAGSNPGNLYIIGGCSQDNGGSIAGVGCSGYSSEVWKCNITNTGTVTSCSTTGQLQIGTVTGNDGNPTDGGLGAFAGAVYANYIYLMGGLSDSSAASGNTNGTDLTFVRYARFDDSNNIVAASGLDWVEGSNEMVTGRRRGTGFGYNGYLYVMGGYDGTDAIADIEFAKINVSDGSWETFTQSSVTIQKRWALTSVVSNSYVYVVGGCTAGAAPSSCNTRTSTIQTFQIYNNDSGTPVSYAPSANLFTTDRMGAGSVIYNGFIYVAGGCISTTSDCSDATDNTQFASVDTYGVIGTWANTTDATLPGERAHGKLLEAGGTLYWVGGQNDAGTAQTDVYYAVPDAGTGNIALWNTASNVLPAARSQFGAASWNNRLYITGGVNAGTVQNTVYVSPTVSSTTGGGNIGSAWSTSTAFDVARSGHTTVAYANNLYVFGGYDGTNYLNDSQFTQINSDGTVDAWTFTTALPGPLRQADGFAANGYLYLVGGRTNDTTCASKTLVTPISANTTIATGNNPTGVGEWFETNVKYSGRRYGASVSYANGKYYTLGGVCNGFPSFKERLTQNFSTAATSHAVTMPSTVDAGDLLLVLFTNDANSTVTTPSGWTLPTNGSVARGTAARGSVYIKVAGGTEDGTTVDFVTSAAEEAASQVYRIPAGEWSGTTAGVEVANSGDPGATTTTPNPPALNPGGWGTENTLWISYAAGSSYTAVTTYPTNYNGGAHNLSNTGTAGASVSSAWLESAVASEDPGTFTMSTNSDGVAFTIGIRTSGYALTGANRVVQTAVYSQPQVAIYSRMIDTDTDVFPTSWLLNGIDNSIGARWQTRYRSMHDTSDGAGQQNPNEDCGTSATMPLMTTWGQETNYGDTTLGDVAAYTAYNSSGGNINCARYFYFYVSIDASRTFGYPEDVSRGPTIADLSLFFTSDPSKRLRHGKTFTGGEQQPLDTPCRQSVDPQCSLP